MTPKVAFVVQRYGLDVNGGAELHCRWIAELMKDIWDVEVVTTCANDYMTWANYYPEGREEINGVTVHRFPVIEERDIEGFNRHCEKVFWMPHSKSDEIGWMKAQGPNTPGLINHIEINKDNFDAFIFFTYLYGTTFWGLPLVKEKAFLVPTAHNEPPIYLSIFAELFQKPKGFIFNSLEEKELLANLFDIDCTFSDVVGVGIMFDPSCLDRRPSHLALPRNYVINVGRIDASKGCKELFEFWETYKRTYLNDLVLLLIGRSQMEIPKRDDVLKLGFVSEEDKFVAMSTARCLIAPSAFESLSMVIMESWLCGRPVLVNGRCNVLKGQCRRSNGGLWYENYEEFEASLNFILANEDIARKMAESGKRYTEENYNMLEIRRKYVALISNFLESRQI